LNDPKFIYKPDFAFALHNIQGMKKNQIVVKTNTFSCATIIKLKGLQRTW
jgi:hypothetical protein